MKFIIISLFLIGVSLPDEYQYSLQDYNTTSPTYGNNVWEPEYSDYITMHFFSSQG